jgi:parallel beta-helix repeat protein
LPFPRDGMAQETRNGGQMEAPYAQNCDGRPVDAPACDDCTARLGHPTQSWAHRIRAVLPAWVGGDADDDNSEAFLLVEPRVTRRGLAELLTIGAATTYALFKAPRAMLALRAGIPTAQMIFVGPGDDDDCETIGEAIAVAGPQVTIAVAKGTYHESLVVRNGVAIVARKGHRVEIAPPAGPAITVVGGDPFIKGLVLRSAPMPAPGEDRLAPAICVTGGSPTVRDCEIRGVGGDGVRVSGADTVANIVGTVIHGPDGRCQTTEPAGAGMRFDDGTGGTVESCTIHLSGAAWIGVHVGGGANPIVRDTKVISGTGGVGVRVGPGGGGTFERCAVSARVGMTVNRAHPMVRASQFAQCDVGLEVIGPDGGTYEQCTFGGYSRGVTLVDGPSSVFDTCEVAARDIGVLMGAGVGPRFFRTDVSSVTGAALVAEGGARGQFVRCSLGKNSSTGVEPSRMDPNVATVVLRKHASTQFASCTIADGPGAGVEVAASGGGTFTDTTICANAGPGMVVGPGATPVVRGGEIASNGGMGVYVQNGGGGTFVGCTIRINHASGLHLESGAETEIRNCQITSNGHHGVVVGAGAVGRITDCTVDGNASGDWLIDRDARVQVSGTTQAPA